MRDYATHKTFLDFEKASFKLKYEAAKKDLHFKFLDPRVSTFEYEQSYCDYRIALANKIMNDIKNFIPSLLH